MQISTGLFVSLCIRHGSNGGAGSVPVIFCRIRIDGADGTCIGEYGNTHLFQNLCSNSSGRHTPDGLTTGRTATTPIIPKTVFGIKAVICMAGTVILCNLAVICGDLGGIADHQGDGSTGGLSVKDTGQNLHLIGFFTLCSDSTGAGFTAIQIFLNLFFGERKSGGTAVHDDTQCLSVGFSPGSDLENVTKC